jgi:hypothetical protein
VISVQEGLEPRAEPRSRGVSSSETRARSALPVALFLTGREPRSDLPRLAATRGFRSITVPWQQCEATPGGVTAEESWEVQPDGARIPLPPRITLSPTLIAVVVSALPAFDRGRTMVLACDALWGHSGAPHSLSRSRGPCEYAAAIVEFRPEWAPLAALPPEAGTDAAMQLALDTEIEELNRGVAPADPVLHRTFAPFAVRRHAGRYEGFDPLLWLPRAGERDAWESLLVPWLDGARERTIATPIVMPGDEVHDFRDTAIHPEHFPEFFGTPRWIPTARAPRASFVHLDPALAADASTGDLADLLCRRRAADDAPPEEIEMRLTETGVGRACLVRGLHLADAPQFHDFTVLGVGLTPFSEGGFVEIGRDIDGKAAMLRAWHRKACAERLETAGCRAARVVALADLPGEEMLMTDGSMSPAALVVRAFRCVLRVKQLDPLVCALHSPQHTPLIAEYLAIRARARLPGRTLRDDEELAWTVERQPASQASLRTIVAAPVSRDPRTAYDAVHRVRAGIIESYAPLLLAIARRRLALEWRCEEAEIADRDYLFWFAGCVASQLRRWQKLRFLHDYHHPGFSRWHPGTLFSLGENNVTLLAEFADLDTGVFVDDPDDALRATLQLTAEDVVMLRERYATFHQRDVEATGTVVQTLASIVARGDPATIAAVAQHFRSSVDDA